ncbi:hypothetical protein OPT61_g9190 [Boeremia exigua]|uniref:Uncharacterized protein n=1 Tax=Boeremia exigua TaxID=749465 RepID=A0ACC2HW17_9PLEO|nr:hypothetical protein OPT61_g9190 [Boeremia exigua]
MRPSKRLTRALLRGAQQLPLRSGRRAKRQPVDNQRVPEGVGHAEGQTHHAELAAAGDEELDHVCGHGELDEDRADDAFAEEDADVALYGRVAGGVGGCFDFAFARQPESGHAVEFDDGPEEVEKHAG